MKPRRIGLAALSVVLAATAAALPAFATSRLEYSGTALGRRQVESAVAKAFRSPRDSAALAAGLGRLVAELEQLGYLDARAHGRWTGTRAEDATLVVEMSEGVRYRLALVALDTSDRSDSLAFAAALGLAPGGWVSPRGVGEAVNRALAAAVETGHPYALLGVTSFEWDSAGARVRLSGTLGPAVTISQVRIEGLRVTRSDVAARAMGRVVGTSYSRAAAEAARDRLAQLGIFDRVTYQGLEGEGDWKRGHLVYRVNEPQYNRLDGAIGVQGESQAVGLLRLGLGNLAGTGRATELSWESRGRGVEHFLARYVEPLVLGAPLRAQIALEQHVEDTVYTHTRVGARLEFLLSGRQQVEAGYVQERVVQRVGLVEDADLQTTEFGLERDARDQRDAPRRGTRVRMDASQTTKSESLRPLGRRKARASAVRAALEWHRPWGRGEVPRGGLALELSGASRFSSERVLPVFERYAVGGTLSLRGHDEQAFRVDRYALSRLEWRWFLGLGRQRVALFWDHAWMGTRTPQPSGGDRFDLDHADGVGFGLRLEAGGGVIGLDYGVEPGRAPLEGKLHLQLVSAF